MTVTTSYPGVYIQELPSLVHTIQPAPTSIAVFIGYTHPFLTKIFNTPVQLFSFADYQTNFGGFFYSPWQPDYVGQAVFQFFLNGGTTCYVVAIQPNNYYDDSVSPPAQKNAVGAAIATIGTGDNTITFKAVQPVALSLSPPSSSGQAVPGQAVPGQAARARAVPGQAARARAVPGQAARARAARARAARARAAPTQAPGQAVPGQAAQGQAPDVGSALVPAETLGIPMQIQLSNFQPATTPATADIVISYGTTVETYRKVTVANLQTTSDLQNGVSVPPRLRSADAAELNPRESHSVGRAAIADGYATNIFYLRGQRARWRHGPS